MRLPVQVSAARVPLPRPRRDEPRRARGRSSSTSCSTPASSTTTATSTSIVEYAKAGPDDILVRITVHNRGPEAARLHAAADAVVPQHVVVEAAARRSRRCARPPVAIVASHPELGDYVLACDGDAGAAVHREREQRRRALAASRTRRRASRTPSTATSSAAMRRRQPGADRHEGRGALRARRAGGRRVGASGCACSADATASRSARLRRDARRPASPRPTSSTRGSRRRRSTDDERRVHRQALAGHAVEQAVLPVRRRPVAQGARRASAARPRGRRTSATPTGSTCSTATSSRCPTSGSTRGTRRGTSRSTRWPCRSSTSTSRRSSCC